MAAGSKDHENPSLSGVPARPATFPCEMEVCCLCKSTGRLLQALGELGFSGFMLGKRSEQ